jgi:hypothetical protein
MNHLSPGHLVSSTYKNNWLRGLKKAGFKPEMVELEKVEGLGNEEEVFWIGYLKAMGCRLTNLTLGGEGALGVAPANKGKKHTPEAIAKIAAASRGRKNNFGKKWTSETNRKRGLNNPRRKAIQDMNGRVYESIKEAELATGVWSCQIRRILAGESRASKGYTFSAILPLNTFLKGDDFYGPKFKFERANCKAP